MPLVSILIPCHNAAPWLAATLESTLAVTWPEREIIVVDDGSTDASLDILRNYEGRGIRVIEQPNRGASAARNAALRAARGDWFQFLDADDLLAPDKIANQLTRPALIGPNTTFTSAWGRFREDPRTAIFVDSPLCATLAPREFLLRYCNHDCMMHPAAWLVPRAVALQAGPWDETLSLNDDGEYFARVALASDRLVYCPGARSFYRSGLPTSLSRQTSHRHLESALHAAESITRRMRENLGDDPEVRRAAANLFQRFAHDYYPLDTALTAAAETAARELGGATIQPLGGRGFQIARRVVGWKMARRLQVVAGRHVYAKSSR